MSDVTNPSIGENPYGLHLNARLDDLQNHADAAQATADGAQTDINAHESASPAHAASAISAAPFLTITGTNVQAQLEEIFAEAGGGGGSAIPYFLPETYGAVGDGVTDDTAALGDCIAAALPVNGTILLSKMYGATAKLQFAGAGQVVTLIGCGPGSGIRALHANASLWWGDPALGAGTTGQTRFGRPGMSHSWTFDGNGLATTGVLTGVMVAYGTFANIQVMDCAGVGIRVGGTQNTTFLNCVSSENTGNGWTIDDGAQGCEFVNCHAHTNTGWGFQILQTNAGWGVAVAGSPGWLRFRGGISEQNTTGSFNIREGVQITLDGTVLFDGVDTSLVLSAPTIGGTAVGHITVTNIFTNGIYIDAESGGSAQAMGGNNEPLFLLGANYIPSMKVGSTGYVVSHHFQNTAAVFTYTPEGTGAAAYIWNRHLNAGNAGPKADWNLAQIDVNGNAVFRYGTADQVKIGTVSGLPGAAFGASLDAILIRDGAASLLTNKVAHYASTAAQVPVVARGFTSQTANLFNAEDVSGTVLTSILAGGAIEVSEQSDPAAPAADKARLYCRDNGAGKTQLVVRFPTGAIQVLATEP